MDNVRTTQNIHIKSWIYIQYPDYLFGMIYDLRCLGRWTISLFSKLLHDIYQLANNTDIIWNKYIYVLFCFVYWTEALYGFHLVKKPPLCSWTQYLQLYSILNNFSRGLFNIVWLIITDYTPFYSYSSKELFHSKKALFYFCATELIPKGSLLKATRVGRIYFSQSNLLTFHFIYQITIFIWNISHTKNFQY